MKPTSAVIILLLLVGVPHVAGFSAFVLHPPKIEMLVNNEKADVPPGPNIPAGNSIIWTYKITLNGDAPFSNVKVVGDSPMVIPVYQSGDINNNKLLDTGEIWIYLAKSNAEEGQHKCTGNVTAILNYASSGITFINNTFRNSATCYYFGVSPGEKTASQLQSGENDKAIEINPQYQEPSEVPKQELSAPYNPPPANNQGTVQASKYQKSIGPWMVEFDSSKEILVQTQFMSGEGFNKSIIGLSDNLGHNVGSISILEFSQISPVNDANMDLILNEISKNYISSSIKKSIKIESIDGRQAEGYSPVWGRTYRVAVYPYNKVYDSFYKQYATKIWIIYESVQEPAEYNEIIASLHVTKPGG